VYGEDYREGRVLSMEQVIIDQFGAVLSKKSERLIVKAPQWPSLEPVADAAQAWLPFPEIVPPPKGEEKPKGKSRVILEVPFFRIAEIVIASQGVSLSSDLVEECCERGIRISFLDHGGRPFAMLSSPMLTATVATRRAQMEALNDGRGAEFSRLVVVGKLRNQANLLKYIGKYLKEAHPEKFEVVESTVDILEKLRGEAEGITGPSADAVRPGLMGIEGSAGRVYWEGVQTILAGKTEFPGREHRGTLNPVNACLNYGYGILYAQVWGAVMNAGLEPFAGFLHVDRPGKPSLVLDLIEEFRQPVVDRAVIAMFNQGQAIDMKQGLLDETSRRAVADKIVERLKSPEPFEGRRYEVRSIIQMQARHVATFLRGERPYRPFAFKW